MRKLVSLIVGIFVFLGVMDIWAVDINGAGATFPYPLYAKMFEEYYKLTGVKVNYQPIGSGGGIRQLIDKSVDFGASDAPMTEEEMKEAKAPVIHIPTCLGAVVLTYNLPGNPEIKLDGETIAEIFMGKITKWDDPKIKALNPDVKLPSIPIQVVYRSDGSGTTYVFTDYLSKVSKEWEKNFGRGKVVNWAVGVGGKGNAGVTALVIQTPGAIGYVELAYALQNKLPVATIRNKSGNFIKPTLESISMAGNIKTMPDDTCISITDTPVKDGYPISSFTWIIVYKDLKNNIKNKEKAEALVKLLWWIVHDGQEYTKPLHYAPLPPVAKQKAEKNIKSITFDGKPILK